MALVKEQIVERLSDIEDRLILCLGGAIWSKPDEAEGKHVISGVEKRSGSDGNSKISIRTEEALWGLGIQ
jgi:hypothetical protein